MSKIGHEAPLFDNTNPANLTPRADEAQMRIGQEMPIVDPTPKQLPPALQLTEKEQVRVDRLVETQGLDRGTALLYSVPRSKARRIIGHMIAEEQIGKFKKIAETRRENEPQPGPSTDELIEILKSTKPQNDESPPDMPTSEAA